MVIRVRSVTSLSAVTNLSGPTRGAAFAAAAVFLAAALGLAPAAEATQVKFPQTGPRIALDVPDGWSVSYTPIGLELQSPDKTSIVLADIVKRDERPVEVWAKAVNKRLAEKGVVFNKKARPPRTLTPKPEASIEPEASVGKPSGGYSFSDAPTLAPSFGAQDGGIANSKALLSQSVRRPYKVVQTFGATLDKQPVDLELAMYALGADDFFLIEQQSGPTDARASLIVKSFRPVP